MTTRKSRHRGKETKKVCNHDGCTNQAKKGGVCWRHGAKATMSWYTKVAPSNGAKKAKKATIRKTAAKRSLKDVNAGVAIAPAKKKRKTDVREGADEGEKLVAPRGVTVRPSGKWVR